MKHGNASTAEYSVAVVASTKGDDFGVGVPRTATAPAGVGRVSIGRNRREQEWDALPAIVGAPPAVDEFDSAVGQPGVEQSDPVHHVDFLQKLDFAGEFVLPFATYAVGANSDVPGVVA